jgi:hypothetical protein
MKMLKGSSGICLAGHALFWGGALSYLYHLVFVYRYSLPLDTGISYGSCAILLLGWVTLAVGKCLKNLEGRLDQIGGEVIAGGDAARPPNVTSS